MKANSIKVGHVHQKLGERFQNVGGKKPHRPVKYTVLKNYLL